MRVQITDLSIKRSINHSVRKLSCTHRKQTTSGLQENGI